MAALAGGRSIATIVSNSIRTGHHAQEQKPLRRMPLRFQIRQRLPGQQIRRAYISPACLRTRRSPSDSSLCTAPDLRAASVKRSSQGVPRCHGACRRAAVPFDHQKPDSTSSRLLALWHERLLCWGSGVVSRIRVAAARRKV
ncbi:hypothetical protein FH972_022024 [Carpinus fangiana]|uniref:Uncharacterized protein n=1 Tax=Carpinus fangiana TaxID=176857 RepID=A0A5N6KRD9_9ROSI|nr:hypothetical protein FH972_022024 [Carpinus fangiana]